MAAIIDKRNIHYPLLTIEWLLHSIVSLEKNIFLKKTVINWLKTVFIVISLFNLKHIVSICVYLMTFSLILGLRDLISSLRNYSNTKSGAVSYILYYRGLNELLKFGVYQKNK